MAAQGAFGTDVYERSVLRPKHPAYYRSGRPVLKIGPKGALGSHEIRPIHSAPSLGQSIQRNIICPIHMFQWAGLYRNGTSNTPYIFKAVQTNLGIFCVLVWITLIMVITPQRSIPLVPTRYLQIQIQHMKTRL